jgi:guanylate kinase
MAVAGNLIIVSGPSGSGKSTVASMVLAWLPDVTFSVSYTSREPRKNEKDGVDYYFVAREEFERLLRADELLEWATVYGNYYGTSKRLVEEALARGRDVLLDVDVQGARSIRNRRPEAVSIFILPPSYPVLRERLERRASDKHYVIEQRLQIACEEVAHYIEYDYLIINNEVARAAEELKAIILASRCRMSARVDMARSVVSTFGGVDD